MLITYNLDTAKSRVIELIKRNAYDFCTDMLKEIKRAAENNSIDDVEGFTLCIRQAESTSERQIKSVSEAKCITDILISTVDLHMPGNVLCECDDEVLKAIFGYDFQETI